ncbi:MAG: hypothetical protein Q8R04_02275, partial [Nanoarchaeota archaeon]|nr:hypothetical protein [Nanoarchaeota archaeon]
MKKVIILVFVFLVILSTFAYSVTLTAAELNQLKNNTLIHAALTENCTGNIENKNNVQGTITGTVTFDPATRSCYYDGGWVTYSNTNNALSATTNKTILCLTNHTEVDNDESFLASQAFGGGAEDILIWIKTTAGARLIGGLIDSYQLDMRVETPSWYTNNSWKVIAVMVNTSGTSEDGATYYNNNRIATATYADALSTNTQSFRIGQRGSAYGSFNGGVRVCLYVNYSINDKQLEWITQQLALNDTNLTGEGSPAPPEITYYNLTNENGCENWITNKSNACNTSSVTPTIQFNTNEPAWCAISGNNSATLGINYTDMGNSRNCTGASAGEGTTSHLCTLTSQDELVYDTSYLFISCKDSSGNQNLTSTSGALKLSITGLEDAGRTSIGIGIQNALLSGYTNYTDLQIYARNLSNAQVRGTFDRAAKKG